MSASKTPEELFNRIIRTLIILKAKEVFMTTPDQDAQGDITIFVNFLTDLGDILPEIQAALTGAGSVSADTLAKLDSVAGQVAPLQAQFDALATPPPAATPATGASGDTAGLAQE